MVFPDLQEPDQEFLQKDLVCFEAGENCVLKAGEVFPDLPIIKSKHAWKIDPNSSWLFLYGFVQEDFMLHSVRIQTETIDRFCSWSGVLNYAKHYNLQLAQVVETNQGTFFRTKEGFLTKELDENMRMK